MCVYFLVSLPLFLGVSSISDLDSCVLILLLAIVLLPLTFVFV
jgi:hypothetical protein